MDSKKQALSSLEELFSELKTISMPLSEVATRTLLTMAAGFQEALVALKHSDPVTYSRNRIFSTQWMELLVLCWQPGQRSPPHDHAGSRCGVHILQGEATEIGFEQSGSGVLAPTSSSIFSAGETTVSYDSEIHMVGNFSPSEQELVTLHCYSPPLLNTNVYSYSDASLAIDGKGIVASVQQHA